MTHASVRSNVRRIATGAILAAAAAVTIGAQGRGANTGPASAPPAPAALAAIYGNADPVQTCEGLKSLTLANTVVDTAAVDPGNATTPASCRVTLIVTHPPASDQVKVFLAFPMKGWNGRFEGTGGGGWVGGTAAGVAPPLSTGFAAGATDTGHDGGSASFALDANNRFNWPLIRDNTELGIHDMTTAGKALTEAFYGKAPRYSYFNGCSTGGRQGLMEAQRFPADYDGILAGAPATNWTKLHVEQMWGPLVMLDMKNVVPNCKFAAATSAAIAACDTLDGVKDGVIEDPRACTYDPKALVGTKTDCGVVTEADAAVIRAIWNGPHRRDGSFMWYGLERGGDFTGLSATGGTPLGPRPLSITLDWWRYFLTQNPQWDWTTLTPASYEQYFDESVEAFSGLFATDNPDLAAFRDRGGKLVLWHGWADQLIYPKGTIDYYTRVEKQMGGAEKTGTFARLFFAPGVGHCGGGNGPAPSGQFEAVVRWVEQGHAPDTLDAVRREAGGRVTRSRVLCPYPLVAHYKGQGSTDDKANFACRAN